MNKFNAFFLLSLLVFSGGFVNSKSVSSAQVSFDLFESLVAPILSFFDNVSGVLFGDSSLPATGAVTLEPVVKEYPEDAYALPDPSETLGDACVCPNDYDICPALPCQGEQLCIEGQCAVPTSNHCLGFDLSPVLDCCPIGGTTFPTNVLVDPENCGSCGNDCTPGGPVPNPAAANCVLGSCQNNNCDALTAGVCNDLGLGCCTPNDADVKSITCANFLVDEDNCGGCGNSCSFGEVCTAGVCRDADCSGEGIYGCAATGGLQCCGTLVGELCTSILIDPTNCGGCGNSCSGSQTCVSGQCTQCGNGSCEEELGESCQNCADCTCTSGNCSETSPGSGDFECL